ncbi:MAG: hypothetical protein COA97_09310 [Flavobacteriales bacterium]|nr:MAG: hypothetical protein COA97_09310 [Flavobacteriales bacterium]
MEIEDIRKELNHLLNSVVDHSSKFSDERPIPSLEISFVLTKINKLQENLAILKHLLKEQEIAAKRNQSIEKKDTEINIDPKEDQVVIESAPENNNAPIVATQGDTLKQGPIPKLIDALTLNDRYLYANELFNKDMNSFNELIKSIDDSSSLNEANSLISPLNLDAENEHVISFTNLVERRFS